MKTQVSLAIFVIGFVFLAACKIEPISIEILTPTATLTPSPASATATVIPSPAPTHTPRPPTSTPTATTPPAATPTPLPGIETARLLRNANLPNRNPEDLAHRFKEQTATPVEPANNFLIGDRQIFWALESNSNPPQQFKINATLEYVTGHAYWWVADGFSVPQADIRASAETFENNTYPTNRQFFGREWSPGIDDDERVHIVMGNIPGVAGYFYAANEYARWAVENSNEHEMFLINLNAVTPGSRQFDGVLAHEFQHMIHWNQDPNEDAWVNEGLSELAEFINGYGISSFSQNYLQQPDTQLTAWSGEAGIRNANYGASFLFMLYLYDKFGAEAIKELTAQPGNGISAVEAMLQQFGNAATFDDLIADFIIANYLNDPALEDGRWGYTLLDADLPPVRIDETYSDFPVETTNTVRQYGADYIEIVSGFPLTLNFSASTTVTLLNNQPHSGNYQWYSNRGDSLDSTLTRAFDLSALTEATLEFWAWYDIEADWDYAYVTVSSDNGQTWDILPATTTVDANPSGNAYGPGFTGKTEWTKQTVDLSPYTGQKILLRFEYITDDAVNQPGFAVDDISIPQLNYAHNSETDDDNWIAEGFIRTDNILPQKFSVQIITFDASGNPTVQSLALNERNNGSLALQPYEKAIMVISAHAPVTTNPAQYTFSLYVR